MQLQYLTSHTNEEDPARREAKLREYRARAKAEMSAAGTRGTDVIELGEPPSPEVDDASS